MAFKVRVTVTSEAGDQSATVKFTIDSDKNIMQLCNSSQTLITDNLSSQLELNLDIKKSKDK